MDLRRVADDAGFDPAFYLIPAGMDILINFNDYQNLFNAALGRPHHAEENGLLYNVIPVQNGMSAGVSLRW